ncbi:MAG: hypothetical protein ACOYM2_04750 [Rectinemataceae bacterium]
MARHFLLDITDDGFTGRRKIEAIAAEASRDGLYAVRSKVLEDTLSTDATVYAYRGRLPSHDAKCGLSSGAC